MTTSAILLECGNAASPTSIRPQVVLTRARMTAAGDLIDPTAEDVETTWAASDRGEAGAAGIVDQISFAVIRRLGLTRAFTNDRHFTTAGFETLF